MTTSVEQALAGSSKFSISEQVYRDTEEHVTTRLREVLADGPADREYIDMVVKATEQQLYRAAERLGVVKRKASYSWTWMLPEHVPKWEEQQQERRAEQLQERKLRKNKREQMARREKRRAREAAGFAAQETMSPAGQPETGAATVRERVAAASSRARFGREKARLGAESFDFHRSKSNADQAGDPPWREKPPPFFERAPTEFEIDLAACPESRIKAVNSEGGNSVHEALLRDAAG